MYFREFNIVMCSKVITYVLYISFIMSNNITYYSIPKRLVRELKTVDACITGIGQALK